MSYRLLLAIFFYLGFSFSTGASECLGWFLESGLAPKSSDCELKCSVTPVDMSTFPCASKCEDLCKRSLSEQVLAYAPRLTEGDRVVVAKMPYEAYRVFVAKTKVDKLTLKIFKSPKRKDESDAFRHFVWSALLAKDLGIQKAKIFLDAHEEDSTQSQAEKQMDLANNQLGLDFFSSKKKSMKKPVELIDIEREALLRLRDKKLRVIESRYKEIPNGYYSN